MESMIVKQNSTLSKKRATLGRIISKVVIYLVLTLLAIAVLFPYFWMLMTSFKDNYEAISLTLKIFPEKFLFANYVKIWQVVPMLNGMVNTIIVEVSVIVVGTLVTAIAAFSFAKMKLRFKTFWLLLLMSGMMVPYAALLLPQYQVFQALNMTDTLFPLILPGLFGNITMMFFFVQYMKGIPSAFFEAAKIDGAGYMKMFFSIMLPLVKTALAAQIIFWFIGIWNDYFAPAVYLKSYDVMTLQPMLAKLNSDNAGGTNLPLIMTGSVISSIPMFVIYVVFQRFFIESMAISGVKG